MAFDLRLNAFLTRVYYRMGHRSPRFSPPNPWNGTRPLTGICIGMVSKCRPGLEPFLSHIQGRHSEVMSVRFGDG